METSPNRYYLGLCAIAKDETPFLREWVAYHHLLGFEQIFIYDNESSVSVSQTLGDMIYSGMVTVYTIQGRGQQLVAYNHCLKNHGPECEWMAFFDLDEFMLLRREEDARVFCSRYEDYSALCLNWNTFSSSGHLGRPEGLVMANYQESLGAEVELKCIVRPERVKLCISPHHFTYTNGCAVNAARVPVMDAYAPVADEEAVLNHYLYRSQQDYEDKMRRGDAIFVGFDPRKIEHFYRQAARPVQVDDAMQRHVTRVKESMATGQPDPYIPLNSGELLSEPFPSALARLAALLKDGKASWARAAYRICRSRFSDKASYHMLGGQACREAGDGEGARQAALDLLALSQSLPGYLELFLAEELLGHTAAAQALADFILKKARAGEDDEVILTLKEKGFAAGQTLV